MRFGKYRFICRLENDAILPAYKGSTFRGVFGHALKKVTCALKQKECDKCLLQQSCLYSLVFEAPHSTNKNSNPRFPTPPHPFVIEPPLTSQTHYPDGSYLKYNLLLFGEYNTKLPYFIYAFDCMGKIGIGKRIKGMRGKFSLKRVQSDDQLIYENHECKVKIPDTLQSLSFNDLNNIPGESKRLRLNLHTPLRLKFRNQLQAELPFHILVRATLRRISSLFFYYGNGEPSFDYKSLIHEANQIQIVDSDLKWIDWRRYSNRQDQAMLMGGITGSIVYEGKLSKYLPLIKICSKVHLGKQSTFGLGKITAELIV
jgi:hypothetical protein